MDKRAAEERFAALEARSKAIDREREEWEKRRTQWLPKDSGYEWHFRPEGGLDPSQLKPGVWYPQWQGLVHSSARPEVAAENARQRQIMEEVRRASK